MEGEFVPFTCEQCFSFVAQPLKANLSPLKRHIEEKKTLVESTDLRTKRKDDNGESANHGNDHPMPAKMLPLERTGSSIYRPDEENFKHRSEIESFALIGILRLLGQNTMLMEHFQMLLEEEESSERKRSNDHRALQRALSDLRNELSEKDASIQNLMALNEHAKAQAEEVRSANVKLSLSLADKEDEVKTLLRQNKLLEAENNALRERSKEKEAEILSIQSVLSLNSSFLAQKMSDFALSQQGAMRITVEIKAQLDQLDTEIKLLIDCQRMWPVTAIPTDIVSSNKIHHEFDSKTSSYCQPEHSSECTECRKFLAAVCKILDRGYQRNLMSDIWSVWHRESSSDGKIDFSKRNVRGIVIRNESQNQNISHDRSLDGTVKSEYNESSLCDFSSLDSKMHDIISEQNLKIVNLEHEVENLKLNIACRTRELSKTLHALRVLKGDLGIGCQNMAN